MIKDNKGYSLVELIIVIAIMVILAGLGMVTYNVANSHQPAKAKSNLISASKYAKSLVQAQDKDYCVALFKASDAAGGNYYAVYGTSTGTSQADLQTNFVSQYVDSTTEAGSTESVVRNNPANGKTLDDLMDAPKSAQDVQKIGERVTISYNNVDIQSGKDHAVIIKFSKFDGSVKAGAGTFKFRKKGDSRVSCSTVLNENTGAFRDGD